MQALTIRYVLLFIGALIVLGILWDGLRRDKRTRMKQKKDIIKKGSQQEKKEADSLEELMKPIIEESLADTSFHIDEEEPILSEDMLEDLIKEHKKKEIAVEADEDEDIISLYVMAKEGKSFEGYDLLQTILDNNMQYGDMQIFHRYKDDDANEDTLFSLASATEPGEFNLQQMGSFSCKGLILFMNISLVEDSLQVFEEMMDTALHLAEALDGVLKLTRNTVLTEELIEEIRENLRSR